MRYMILRKADAETEAGVAPWPELIDAMMAYNQEMLDAGVMKGGDGLMPSSQGARIRFRGGQPHVLDGPFTEAKELIAGYTIIEVGSHAEALEWVRRWPVEDGHGNVELELRRLYEADDFEPDFAARVHEQERQLSEGR